MKGMGHMGIGKPSRTFLPQADAIPMGGDRYRPVYRWHREDDFKFVPGSQAMRGRTAARRAGEDYLVSGLNKQLGGPVEPDGDVLGIEDWKQRKAEDATAERDRVFGTEMPAAIYRNGREIKIERRRRA